jgi:uncharacterized ion transporter superfamily protein YfcC
VAFRVPHPIVLLAACVAVASVLTWTLPAGVFERRTDSATGRTIVVPGTYRPVEATPVGPLAAAVAVPRGFVEAAEVVAVVLFVGAAWVVVDRLGTLARLVGLCATIFGRRRVLAVPSVAIFFGVMGGLENMQEEIIPMVPALLLFGRRFGIDPVGVVAMSAGAAMVGSAFGPTNPFQTGIALKLAELPPLSGAGIRALAFGVALLIWIGWTMRYVGVGAPATMEDARDEQDRVAWRDLIVLGLMLAPMAAYVYGAMAWGWGFNELSAGFLVAGLAAGLVGRLALVPTIEAYLAGMQALLPAAVMVGVARSVSLVLADGRVIDTILAALSAPLASVSAFTAALLMLPFHALVHTAISSVSGHAVLTLPLLVPLSDLIGLSRQVTVMAYQTGAGLTELLTPTNGSLMAILLAAGVPFGAWLKFAAAGVALVALVGVAAMLALQ